MTREEAILYLEHTGSDDFNLEEHQIQNRLNAIQFLLKENKKLNGTIQTYDILLKANAEENKQLKENWNKLKKWLYEEHYLYVPEIARNSTYQVVLDKMQELQGSDSNVKDYNGKD